MRIRFWVTGDPGTDHPALRRNTACVEARANDGTLIVLDCGTGAHRLGQALMAEAEHPVHGHLMITHTHWDRRPRRRPFAAPARQRRSHPTAA